MLDYNRKIILILVNFFFFFFHILIFSCQNPTFNLVQPDIQFVLFLKKWAIHTSKINWQNSYLWIKKVGGKKSFGVCVGRMKINIFENVVLSKHIETQ